MLRVLREFAIWSVLPIILLASGFKVANAEPCVHYEDHLHWLGAEYPSFVESYGTEAITTTGSLALVAADTGMVIFDLQDLTRPTAVSVSPHPSAMDIEVVAGLAYLAAGDSLHVIDLSDPVHPATLQSLGLIGTSMAILPHGDLVYVGLGNYLEENQSGLAVVDAHTPSAPSLLLQIPAAASGDFYEAMTIKGDWLYVGTYLGNLHIFDISNPASPSLVDTVSLPDNVYDLTQYGDLCYACVGYSGISILNLSNPALPQVVGSLATPEDADALSIVGTTAYLAADDGGVMSYDLSDPLQPTPMGQLPSFDDVQDICVYGSVLLAADYVLGPLVVSPGDATSVLPISSVPSSFALSLAIQGDLLVAGDGYTGALLYDISAHGSPVYLSTAGLLNVEGVAVDGDLLCVAVGYYGLAVVDVSDPALPEYLGGVSFGSDEDYAWKVAVANGYAYVANDENGLEIVSLANPSVPTLVGHIDSPEWEWTQGVAVVGDRAYLAGSRGFYVVDVSVPSNPVQLGSHATQDSWSVTMHDGLAYVMDRSGLLIFDVSSDTNPTMIGNAFPLRADPLGAGPVCFNGDLAYAAMADSGLVIADVSDPTHPFIVGNVNTPGIATQAVSSGYAIYVSDGPAGIQTLGPDCSNAVGVESSLPSLPVATLHQNVPNPFNPRTTIQYTLATAAKVSVKVYDLQGRLVTTLVDEVKPRGHHEVVWRARDDRHRRVASGVYMCVLSTGDASVTKKMILVQ